MSIIGEGIDNLTYKYYLLGIHKMAHRLFVVCMIFVSTVSISINALPPPSPAGGNYLVLDGKDDYAELDFNTHGILFQDEIDEFTVEAWIYPTKPPDDNITGLILCQQVRMRVVSYDNPGYKFLKQKINWKKGDLLLITDAHVAGWGGDAVTPFMPITLSLNQWHHIAFQAKGRQTTTIVNDTVKTMGQGTIIGTDVSKFWRPKDLTLGGFGEKIVLPNIAGFYWHSFTGYIDEVRISTVARYNIDKKIVTPDEKFKKDKETIALWHFDEYGRTDTFSDSSGNKYHLVGKNGAKTKGPLDVQAQDKLATTWGQIKR